MREFSIKPLHFYVHKCGIITWRNENNWNATYVLKELKQRQTIHAVQKTFDTIIIWVETKFRMFFVINDDLCPHKFVVWPLTTSASGWCRALKSWQTFIFESIQTPTQGLQIEILVFFSFFLFFWYSITWKWKHFHIKGTLFKAMNNFTHLSENICSNWSAKPSAFLFKFTSLITSIIAFVVANCDQIELKKMFADFKWLQSIAVIVETLNTRKDDCGK